MLAIKKNIFLLVVSCCLIWCTTSSAEEKLTIGVAANFMVPFKEIAHKFETQTDVNIDATFTSTGNLYGQIINGAPYDLFLAADENRPDRLVKEGMAPDSFIYAREKAVLWTTKKLMPPWLASLRSKRFF